MALDVGAASEFVSALEGRVSSRAQGASAAAAAPMSSGAVGAPSERYIDEHPAETSCEPRRSARHSPSRSKPAGPLGEALLAQALCPDPATVRTQDVARLLRSLTAMIHPFSGAAPILRPADASGSGSRRKFSPAFDEICVLSVLSAFGLV